MSSREKILSTIKNNQPEFAEVPEIKKFAPFFNDACEKFVEVFKSVGGKPFVVKTQEEIILLIHEHFPDAKRIVSSCKEISSIADDYTITDDPHSFENVDLFVIESKLAVAENGAVWINDNDIMIRALPFIAAHLAVIIHKQNIAATMHDAYNKIADMEYGFATFISGPSKTADIEQALVLGAHGPKTMTAFILND